MKLNDLKKELPFKWRVQSFSKTKPQASCVAYIDSRDAQDLLDEVCSPENWSVLFEEHKGNLFAKIGIKCGDEWVWKSDCGTESNVEKQKGEASDAFKRAAVMWGVGRFLYSLPILYITANEVKTQNNFPYAVDNKGKRIWDITKHCNGMRKGTAKPEPVKPAPRFTPEQIADAKLKLNGCKTLDKLKEVYIDLGDIKNHPEIVFKKDEMKSFLTK